MAYFTTLKVSSIRMPYPLRICTPSTAGQRCSTVGATN